MENVNIADNSLTMNYVASETETTVTINQTADWQLKLQFPKGKFKEWRVNGKAVKSTVKGDFEFVLIKSSNAELKLR